MDYNTTIIEEFRAGGGRVGGPWAGTTMVLVHHIGARSGCPASANVAPSHLKCPVAKGQVRGHVTGRARPGPEARRLKRICPHRSALTVGKRN